MLTVGIYSNNHRVLYVIGISMTRFQKSVNPSDRVFVCNANKKTYSFIIDSRKIIRVSGERAKHPLQENEEIFKNFRANFRKILNLHKMPALPSLLTIE